MLSCEPHRRDNRSQWVSHLISSQFVRSSSPQMEAVCTKEGFFLQLQIPDCCVPVCQFCCEHESFYVSQHAAAVNSCSFFALFLGLLFPPLDTARTNEHTLQGLFCTACRNGGGKRIAGQKRARTMTLGGKDEASREDEEIQRLTLSEFSRRMVLKERDPWLVPPNPANQMRRKLKM